MVVGGGEVSLGGVVDVSAGGVVVVLAAGGVVVVSVAGCVVDVSAGGVVTEVVVDVALGVCSDEVPSELQLARSSPTSPRLSMALGRKVRLSTRRLLPQLQRRDVLSESILAFFIAETFDPARWRHLTVDPVSALGELKHYTPWS